MENIACDLCGSADPSLVYTVTDTNYGTNGQFQVVQCADCGLVYLNPRPTINEIKKFYITKAYHPFQAINEGQNAQPSETQIARAQRLSQLVNPTTILDVGCGNGLFLASMKNLGWQTYGVEPNEEAVSFASNQLSLDVIQGDIFSIAQNSTFAAISFWDVLEHTHSPMSVLTQANSLLEEGGLLVISVPNWASWERKTFKEQWIAIDAPRHLFHFSPKTLTDYLHRTGFEILELEAKAPVMSPASNLLRAAGKAVTKPSSPASKDNFSMPLTNANTTTSSLKKMLIRLAYLVMTPPNGIASLANKGGAILIFARKNGRLS